MSMSSWSDLLEVLQFLFVFLSMYFGTIHAGDMLRDKDAQFDANYLQKKIPFLKRVTNHWVAFVVCSILSFICAFIGKRIDNSIAEKIYADAKKEYKSDFKQYSIEITDALGKYNLGIQTDFDSSSGKLITKVDELQESNRHLQGKVDSINVVTQGTELISPGEELILIDTEDNQQHLHLIVCNEGDIGIKNVNIDLWEVNKKNINDFKFLKTGRGNFSKKPYCLTIHAFYPILKNAKDYFFVYKITYTKGNNIVHDTKAIMYSYEAKQWGLNGSEFTFIPYEH